MLAASFAMAQAEFSAEIVDLQKPGTPTQAKIYFAKDKMRIESQTASAHGSAVIINYATQTGSVLMAQQHMYMEMPMQAQTSAWDMPPLSSGRVMSRMLAATGKRWDTKVAAATRSAATPSTAAAR
jgi:hypothetical protein